VSEVAVLTSAVQPSVPSLLIAWTFPDLCNANTSATPVELGTAGIILLTPEPSPRFDHIWVPVGNVGPGYTVTFAEALPAVMVAAPTATAVMMGGSSVESVMIAVLLEVQVRPLTGCWLVEFQAWIERVSPTTILITVGTSIN
jgi:hypothetical protein